jgi:hypothetical protein
MVLQLKSDYINQVFHPLVAVITDKALTSKHELYTNKTDVGDNVNIRESNQKYILMKKNRLLSFAASIAVSILISCNSTTSITSHPEQLVHTNGVYIAYNTNASAFHQVGDSAIPAIAIKVLRFTSQGSAILISESLNEGELLDTNKIRVLYNWCLNYESKNPSDNEYIRIRPRFENDTIRFSQVTPDSQTLYKGINYKDSIHIAYQMIYQGKLVPLVKELNFKFYKLN